MKYTDGNYQYDARILCTDLNDELQPIVAAVDFLNKENLKKFSSDGEELYYDNNNNNNNHLFLLFNKFEDGDIVTNYDDGTISIFKSYREDEDEYDSYVEVDIKNKEVNYYDEISYIGFSCLSTEEEKKILNIAILKDNKKWDDVNKKFIILDVLKLNLSPKDWCLMRDYGDVWNLCMFSHTDGTNYYAVGGNGYSYCIPYNEETKKLIGTKNDKK